MQFAWYSRANSCLFLLVPSILQLQENFLKFHITKLHASAQNDNSYSCRKCWSSGVKAERLGQLSLTYSQRHCVHSNLVLAFSVSLSKALHHVQTTVYHKP